MHSGKREGMGRGLTMARVTRIETFIISSQNRRKVLKVSHTFIILSTEASFNKNLFGVFTEGIVLCNLELLRVPNTIQRRLNFTLSHIHKSVKSCKVCGGSAMFFSNKFRRRDKLNSLHRQGKGLYYEIKLIVRRVKFCREFNGNFFPFLRDTNGATFRFV